MKRSFLLLALALTISTSGCCLFHPWCGGCPGYGAGYGAGYNPACPGGNCGVYPGAYYGGMGATATLPYGTPIAGAPMYTTTAALPLNYAPY